MTWSQRTRLIVAIGLFAIASRKSDADVGDKPIVIGDGKSVFVSGDIKFIIPRKDNSILIAPLGEIVADDKGVLVRYRDDNGPKALCYNQKNCMVTVHYASDGGSGETGEIYFFHASDHKHLVILLPSGQFQADPNTQVPTFIEHGMKISSVVEEGRQPITAKGMAEIRVRYLVR